MRVLSLWQPWASLWVAGAHGPVPAKEIETRSWGTRYRGQIAVHASKKWDEENLCVMARQPFPAVLVSLGYTNPLDLPRGCIIGVVELVDCRRMVKACGPRAGEISLCAEDEPRLTLIERAFGHYEPGRFAWITSTVRRKLETPIPFRGAQGLRELDPAVAARLA